jgi:tripartite-type tricarboxylate transporter receptor subunit TctC
MYTYIYYLKDIYLYIHNFVAGKSTSQNKKAKISEAAEKAIRRKETKRIADDAQKSQSRKHFKSIKYI